MSAIEKFLRDAVGKARDDLDAVEKMQDTLSDETFQRLLLSTKERLGNAVQANTEYLDERTSYLGQIEDLREDMKPVRMEAFAKERVKFYQQMAYLAVNAIEDALHDLGGKSKSKEQVCADLHAALEKRNKMSRGQ
jgi:predicted nuclease with TOPRIM domain